MARLIERRDGGPMPHRLSAALTALGPSYVKLGQFLATRPDVVGPALARDLESLQDKMAPFPQAEAEAAVARGLRPQAVGPVRHASARRSPPPRSRRCIAPRSTTADGRRAVAVKVLRPGVERRFQADLAAFRFVARNAEALSAEARRLRLIEVVDTLARSVAIEMDFRLEAAALSEMAENTKDDPRFPRARGRLDAHRARRADAGMDRRHAAQRPRGAPSPGASISPRLGRAVIQSFLRHALRDGFFHADMHPGNLFVDADGRLVAVDFGIMGRLGAKERRFLAEILLGFITRDYRRTAEVHFEAGYVPSHHSVESFAQAIRAIGEPIHNRTAEDISMAKLLTLLFEVTGLFDMRTRPELLLLQKTMVVVEGVARTLDPQARHVDHRRTGGAGMDRAQSRPGRPARRRRAGRGRGRPFPVRRAGPADPRRAGRRPARRRHPGRRRACAGDRRRHRRRGGAAGALADGRAVGDRGAAGVGDFSAVMTLH